YFLTVVKDLDNAEKVFLHTFFTHPLVNMRSPYVVFITESLDTDERTLSILSNVYFSMITRGYGNLYVIHQFKNDTNRLHVLSLLSYRNENCKIDKINLARDSTFYINTSSTKFGQNRCEIIKLPQGQRLKFQLWKNDCKMVTNAYVWEPFVVANGTNVDKGLEVMLLKTVGQHMRQIVTLIPKDPQPLTRNITTVGYHVIRDFLIFHLATSN
ncbi:MAG: hypothetical protein ACRDAT_01640, partial [Cetobacterium sp.]